jgi:hypothetical protein
MRGAVVRAVERAVTDMSRRDAANKYQTSTNSVAGDFMYGL